MAQFVETRQVICPYCFAVGVISVWPCGCKDFSTSGPYSGHNQSQCLGYLQNFFAKFDTREDCGQTGDVQDHQENDLMKADTTQEKKEE